jgi:hypothetical protein
VGGEYGESGAGWLVLIGGSESPESNGPATELSEPTLQLGLGGVVGQTTEMENLASLGQKSAHIGVGIHGASEDLWVFLGRLGFANQTAEDPGEGDRLLHGTARRGGSQCLQVEGQVVFDGSRGLNGLDFEGSTDVGEGAGSERQRLGVVGLPALIFGAQVKSAGVLQEWGQDNGLVTGLAGQLHAQIPRIQRHKSKLELLGGKVLAGKSIESGNGITEGTCGANVLPCESGQTCYSCILVPDVMSFSCWR